MSTPLPYDTPPHALDAERTVLGALLLDPDAMIRISDILTTADFYDPATRTINPAFANPLHPEWPNYTLDEYDLEVFEVNGEPFPPPGDPLFEARSQRITREGGSAFADHALPEAAVTLKQGAGRLIRSESDHGILVVCDSRLSSMSYGRRLVKGLPPMRRLSDHQAFMDAVAQLTTNATSSSTL